ncbi:MAG: methionine--tRNA ligase subunit beta, partial [Clostridiales bacterium]|nr:methionine--tRNA ligase subunit beta [Clostridiales bacterium]
LEFDPKHVTYVWMDALNNYITGIGYDADGNHGENYKKYWPADLHLIGKDILRFHTIYWPIFLMAMGEPLPKQVFGHPWLLQGDGKMSKSKGNVIYADDLARLFGVDAVRYFVLHEMPFDNDGQITWELVAERFNTDLANVLGNLVSRTVSMVNKYFDGSVVKSLSANEADPDAEFKATVTGAVAKVCAKADELRIADAISEIFNIFRRANKYIDETMPWALAKDESNKTRLNDVLYNLSEAIQIGASLLDSFMPDTCAKIFKAFNGESRSLEDCAKFALRDSVTVTAIDPLFVRITDMKPLLAEVEKIRAAQAAAYAAEMAATNSGAEKPANKAAAVETKEESAEEKVPEISFDDFVKVQMRVGEIIACEAVPKSSKLLKETVKFGNETRTIVSGIAKHYKPEEMVGKKVVFVTNLAPRKVCGIVSEGMILGAEDENGNFALIVPEKDVDSGTQLG